jgi:hypothetical protein
MISTILTLAVVQIFILMFFWLLSARILYLFVQTSEILVQVPFLHIVFNHLVGHFLALVREKTWNFSNSLVASLEWFLSHSKTNLFS